MHHAEHVPDDLEFIAIRGDLEELLAQVVASDLDTDLALLAAGGPPPERDIATAAPAWEIYPAGATRPPADARKSQPAIGSPPYPVKGDLGVGESDADAVGGGRSPATITEAAELAGSTSWRSESPTLTLGSASSHSEFPCSSALSFLTRFLATAFRRLPRHS